MLDTTHAERSRESPFLLDQEEENGGSALRVPKPQIEPRKYKNYHGDGTQLNIHLQGKGGEC